MHTGEEQLSTSDIWPRSYHERCQMSPEMRPAWCRDFEALQRSMGYPVESIDELIDRPRYYRCLLEQSVRKNTQTRKLLVGDQEPKDGENTLPAYFRKIETAFKRSGPDYVDTEDKGQTHSNTLELIFWTLLLAVWKEVGNGCEHKAVYASLCVAREANLRQYPPNRVVTTAQDLEDDKKQAYMHMYKCVREWDREHGLVDVHLLQQLQLAGALEDDFFTEMYGMKRDDLVRSLYPALGGRNTAGCDRRP
jgi:hypothetical protein